VRANFKVNFACVLLVFCSPQWEREDTDLIVNGILRADSLSGTMRSLVMGKHVYIYMWELELFIKSRKKHQLFGEAIALFWQLPVTGIISR